MLDWSWEPSVILGTALLVLGYTYATGPGRNRFRDSGPLANWRRAAFFAGSAVLFLALASPLDELSDRYLLSAHMVQHLLLTLVMPPLLLLGMPDWLVRPLMRSWLVAPLARVATKPLVAFVVFNLALALSHLPPIYNLALADTRIHIGLHLTYITTAVLVWWPVFGPALPELSRVSYPLQMLYVFLLTIPGGLVGSAITLSDGVLYQVYAEAPRIMALTPREDQQLAGLLMWLGVSTVHFFIITAMFFVWAAREEPKSLASSSARSGR